MGDSLAGGKPLLAYGLAVGARLSLLLGAVILLVPMGMIWRERAGIGQRPKLWILFLAATGPITVIGLGLLLYNFLRFDDPFEFGEHYMLGWTGQHFTQPQYGVQLFGPRFFWFNFLVYFLEPARWSGRFPFVHDIAVPSLPRGYVGIEHAFGVLPNLPLVGLALVVPLIWRGRLGGACGALRWFGVALVLLFASCALTLCLFFTAYGRYQVEFLAALVWLAALGILGLEQATVEWSRWRRGIRWGWGLLLASSVAFNLCAMLTLTSDLYTSRGVISFHEGRLAEAVAYFQRGLALQPDNAQAHSNIGAALLRQGRVPEAIAHLEEALRLEPKSADAHSHLALALAERGKTAEGIKHLELALRLKPDYAEAHNNLGLLLFRQGKLAEASVYLEQALRFNPDSAQAHVNLGATLMQQGKLAEAVGHLEQALRLKPEDCELHNNLGMALFRQGKHPEATVHLEQAVRLKPEYADAHNNLGVVLVQQGKVVQGIGHLEQAVRLQPEDTEARSNLGTALFSVGEKLAEQGKWDEAIRQYQRAVEVKPDSARVHDALGMALSQVGRFAEAARTAQTALELAKAPGQAEQAKQIQERLRLYQTGRPYREGSVPGH